MYILTYIFPNFINFQTLILYYIFKYIGWAWIFEFIFIEKINKKIQIPIKHFNGSYQIIFKSVPVLYLYKYLVKIDVYGLFLSYDKIKSLILPAKTDSE